MKYVAKKLNKLTNSSGIQVPRSYPGKPLPRLNEDTEPELHSGTCPKANS